MIAAREIQINGRFSCFVHYILLSFGIEISVQFKLLVLSIRTNPAVSMRTNPILSMRTSPTFNGRWIKLMITDMYKEDLGKAFLPQTMDDYWMLKDRDIARTKKKSTRSSSDLVVWYRPYGCWLCPRNHHWLKIKIKNNNFFFFKAPLPRKIKIMIDFI